VGKPKSRVCNAFVPGLLEQYAPGFRAWLLDKGYTPLTTVPQLQLMAHASRWLEREGLTAAGLTGQQAGRFLAARRAAGRPRHPAGLRPLLDYLGGLGVIPPEPSEPPMDAASVLIAEFAEYLRSERGLAPMTVGAYSSRAARFLARYAPDGDPAVIAPGDVTSAVLADASGLSAGAGQHLACALRAFLRYCHVRGLVTADVSAAALSVTGRRTTMLPRGLEPGTIEALLAACDRAEPAGRPAGLRGHPAAGPARPPGRGSRPAPPGRHQLARRRDRDPRQGRPVRRPAAPGRRRRGDRRLAARWPPGRLLPGSVHDGDRARSPWAEEQTGLTGQAGSAPGRGPGDTLLTL
jgi:hypothetical protein